MKWSDHHSSITAVASWGLCFSFHTHGHAQVGEHCDEMTLLSSLDAGMGDKYIKVVANLNTSG